MRSLPSTLVRVTPSGSSTNAAAQRATSAAMPRSGSGSASARSSSASTIASIGHRLVAAGLADGALAFGVGPAGAVGDHVAVVAGEQVADDRAQRVELGGGGVDQPGAQVVAEAEVGAHGVGLALALLVAALALVGGGVAQVGRVEAGAGEVRRVGWPGASSPCSASAWRTASSMNTGSTTQMPAAKSAPRSCT